MKRVTKLFVLLTVAILVLNPGGAADDVDQPVKIGIAQIIEHPALNSTRKGIMDRLNQEGYREGEEVQYLYKNAQGNFENALSIMQTFKAQHVDVVVALTTPVAQAAQKVFSDTPIMAADITDFVVAGLVEEYEDYQDPSGNENLTGVTCMNPVDKQFRFIKTLLPRAEKVGVVYNPGEANSMFLTKVARDVTSEMGLELIEATATKTAEVKMATEAIANRVDALWISNDNTVVAALSSVVKVAKQNNLPVVTTDPTSIGQGPLLAYGWSYYAHGKEAGEVLYQILAGKEPNRIPIREPEPTAESLRMVLNLDTAAAIGFEFPDSEKDRLDEIVYKGVLWERKK